MICVYDVLGDHYGFLVLIAKYEKDVYCYATVYIQ